jgi:hypothetical protein
MRNQIWKQTSGTRGRIEQARQAASLAVGSQNC